MPKSPDTDCGICDGTGLVSQRIAEAFQKDGVNMFTAGSVCVCTVTPEEVFSALPGVINEILDKCPPKE